MKNDDYIVVVFRFLKLLYETLPYCWDDDKPLQDSVMVKIFDGLNDKYKQGIIDNMLEEGYIVYDNGIRITHAGIMFLFTNPAMDRMAEAHGYGACIDNDDNIEKLAAKILERIERNVRTFPSDRKVRV